MEDVQERRSNRKLPSGRWLHEYVNLYLNARNTMMYKRKELHEDLCVIRIRTDVLDIPGTIVSDRNAAAKIALFSDPVMGFTRLDKGQVFAQSWIHDDPVETANHRAIMCAEVLIPDHVGTEYILGAYVSCAETKAMLQAISG